MKAGRVKWQLNKKGVGQLLRSEGVQADLRARANRIANGAGPGVAAHVWQGFDRARARVVTTTEEADLREAEDRALSRAIDLGRDP